MIMTILQCSARPVYVALITVLLLLHHCQHTSATHDKSAIISKNDQQHAEINGATIAFYIAVSPSTKSLLPRFLERIYHPDNVYLIEYHHKIPKEDYLPNLHDATNVYVRHGDIFTDGGVTQVLNTIDAMTFFLDRFESNNSSKQFDFDYFIPLTPSSYPTLSISRLRAFLSTLHHKYNWPTFMHFFHPSHLSSFSYEINIHYVDLSLSFNSSPSWPGLSTKHGHPHPDIRRRTIKIPRAAPLFVASKPFTKFAVDSSVATRILVMLGETSHVDCRFFATLAQNASSKHDDAEAKDYNIGPIVKTASLHCVDTTQRIDQPLDYHGKNQNQPSLFKSNPPTLSFLHNINVPCFFVGPFSQLTMHDNLSVSVRDQIDLELIGISNNSKSGFNDNTKYAGITWQRLQSVFSSR